MRKSDVDCGKEHYGKEKLSSLLLCSSQKWDSRLESTALPLRKLYWLMSLFKCPVQFYASDQGSESCRGLFFF